MNLFCSVFGFHYLCNAVRGAKPFGLAEIIPYEPDMYNDSAGKRYYFSIIICIHRRIPL